MSRLLVVDIGNTRTSVGLWDGRSATELSLFATVGYSLSPHEIPRLARLDSEGAPRADELRGVAVCSVVGRAMEPWGVWAQRNGLEFMGVSGEMSAPLVNRYKVQSGGPGGDRLCAAVAAASRLGTPAIVVSLGTATVVDAVSAEREFLGGVIAAGITMGLQALHDHTDVLPWLWSESLWSGPPGSTIGHNTEECMRIGAILGTAALVEGLVARMRAEIGPSKVALTGGGGSLVAPHLRFGGEVEWAVYPTLVLEGAGIIWEHHHP